MEEFRFTTSDKYTIIVAEIVKPRINVGTSDEYYHVGRSEFTYNIGAAKEDDTGKVVNIIYEIISALLGRNPTVTGKNIVEWSWQSSLNTIQLMGTVCKSLEIEAEITSFQDAKKSTLLHPTLTKLGFRI